MNLGEEMNTHDIELPAEFRSGNDIPVTIATIKWERMEEILRRAIEPYQRRIGELESQLEAIGAGGGGARVTSTPSNASAKITGRSQKYLDDNLDAYEHVAFINWAREAHDYPEYALLILDSEWCQGAVAGWQGAVKADRQQRGEPVAFSYELATTRSGEGEYTHWSPRLSYSMPNVPDGSIRNLKRLYASPLPAEPVKHREVK